MPDREYLDRLAGTLHLTPYQLYVLEQNGDKYDFNKLAKHGDILYAPYKCEISRSFQDSIKKLLLGPRADLIGRDSLLVFDRRGIKLHRDGSYD
jgi:hypothetical protein